MALTNKMARDMTRRQFVERVGYILRRERLALGWTQAELADAANMSVQSVGKIELGDAVTSYPVLMDILWALDASEGVCLEIFRADASFRRVAA